MAKICSARMTCSCTEPGEWPARQPVRVRSCGSAHEPAAAVEVRKRGPCPVCVRTVKIHDVFRAHIMCTTRITTNGRLLAKAPSHSDRTYARLRRGLAPRRRGRTVAATRHAPERRLVRFSRCVSRRVAHIPRKNARATQATDTHGSAACQGAQISSLALLNFSSSWQVPHDCGQRESIEAGFFSHSPLCAQSGHATSLSAHTVCQSNRQRGMSERSAAHAHARARKGNSGRQGAGGLRRSPRRRRRSWGSRASRRPGC